MKSVIYKILNVVTNKFYVGSAVDFKNRCRIHRHHLNKNTHHSHYLQNSWNKYGEQNFEFQILEIIDDKTKLVEIEQYYIDTLKPNYNIAPIAGSRFGIKASEETRKKISACQIGRKQSEESKIKRSLALKGRKHSEETKEKIRLGNKGKKQSKELIERRSLLLKGRKLSSEHKQNLSVAQKKRLPASEETKAKMSASGKGKIISEEAREKMRQAKLGKKHTEEAKARMRGHVISEETRLKLSLAVKARWQRQIQPFIFLKHCG